MKYKDSFRKVILKHQDDYLKSWNEAKYSPEMLQKLVSMHVEMLNFMLPEIRGKETFKIIKILSLHKNGLSKLSLLQEFYPRYVTASFARRDSYRVAIEKMIQRARKVYEDYGLVLYFDDDKKIYKLTFEEFAQNDKPVRKEKPLD